MIIPLSIPLIPPKPNSPASQPRAESSEPQPHHLDSANNHLALSQTDFHLHKGKIPLTNCFRALENPTNPPSFNSRKQFRRRRGNAWRELDYSCEQVFSEAEYNIRRRSRVGFGMRLIPRGNARRHRPLYLRGWVVLLMCCCYFRRMERKRLLDAKLE